MANQILWACPGDAASPWILSGVTKEICAALEKRGALMGTFNSQECSFQRGHPRAKWRSPLHRLVRKFRKPLRPFENERDERFRRMIDGLDQKPTIVYQFIAPEIDTSLDVKRFRFVDISLPDAIRTGSYGHEGLSGTAYERAHSEQLRMFNACDGVLTLSTYAADSIARDFSIPRNLITPIGAASTITESLDQDFGMDRYASSRILFVGRDWNRKGGELLREAFRLVRSRISKATLTIVGPETSPCSDPGVIYVPPINKGHSAGRKKLEQLFKTSSVFCMPTQCDTWGMVFTEACAFGTPIVGLNQWAIPDIVSHDFTGIIVQERTASALAAGLVSLLENPQRLQTMGIEAKQRLRNVLDWTHVADRICFRTGAWGSKSPSTPIWMNLSEQDFQN